jgi:uncharacterized membrane protein
MLWQAIAPRRADRPWLLGLAGVVLVALSMRLPMIMDSLNHDEAYTVMTFAKSSVYALTNYHVPNNHILHSLLVRLSILAFGYAPWAVRLPALVAGLLTILALYGLGRDAYMRPTGFAAALILAMTSNHVIGSARARGYTLLALFAVLLFWLGLLAVRHKSRLAWVGLGLVSGLGMLTMPLMAYPYLALMTWVLAEGLLGGAGPGYRSKGEFLRFWVASGMVALLVTFALYTPAMMVTGPDRMAEIGRVAPEMGMAQTLEAARANFDQVSGAWLGGLSVAARWAVWIGLGLSVGLDRRMTGFVVPMPIASLLAVVGVIIVQRPVYDSRIWFPFLPLVALWVAAGWVGALEIVGRRPAKRIPLAEVACVCALALGLGIAWRSLSGVEDSWGLQGRDEQAVVLLGEVSGPSDALVASSLHVPMLKYYTRLHAIPLSSPDQPEGIARLYVITFPGEGETIEQVLKAHELDSFFDAEDALPVDEISGLSIHVITPR